MIVSIEIRNRGNQETRTEEENKKLPPLNSERFVIPVLLWTNNIDVGVNSRFRHGRIVVDLGGGVVAMEGT